MSFSLSSLSYTSFQPALDRPLWAGSPGYKPYIVFTPLKITATLLLHDSTSQSSSSNINFAWISRKYSLASLMFIGSFKGRISFTNYSSTRSGHQNIRFTLINSKNFTLLSTVLFILIFFHIKGKKIPIKYINLPLYTHSPNIRNQQLSRSSPALILLPYLSIH